MTVEPSASFAIDQVLCTLLIYDITENGHIITTGEYYYAMTKLLTLMFA